MALPLGVSLALHAGAVALLLFGHGSGQTMQVQPYRARLLAAPAGPREEGLVTTPAKELPKVPPVRTPPVRSKTPDVVKVPPKPNSKAAPAPRKETATSDAAKSAKAAAPPVAGGGRVGATGSDVATALFNGLEFPDETYLKSIISKIAKNFDPLDRFALVAEYSFVITRGGCLQGDVKLVKGSGLSGFDAEAKVAILKAGEKCGFNPLPAVWSDDILNIRFRFDPKLIKQ